MLTSSRCQGSPKTRETQKQLVLGETGPPSWVKASERNIHSAGAVTLPGLREGHEQEKA